MFLNLAIILSLILSSFALNAIIMVRPEGRSKGDQLWQYVGGKKKVSKERSSDFCNTGLSCCVNKDVCVEERF
jgi:hypothetical protein